MAEALKLEVKENAHRRRSAPLLSSGERVSPANLINEDYFMLPQKTPRPLASPMCDLRVDGTGTCPQSLARLHQSGPHCTLAGKETRERLAIGRSDAILVMFYLENLFPFLFPFYRPPLLQGGRAWILEMMISSPVVKQALLCQSLYFLSLAQGMANWETVLEQRRDAFEVLRLSLQVISDAGVTEHLHGTVRIFASVVQVQRFEVAVLSFNNCQAHLNAALALFTQLLESVATIKPVCPSSSFNAVLNRLNPTTLGAPVEVFQTPIAEQAAFRFSSALLILDDIIAATILQEQPRLYSYHQSLLYTPTSSEAAINLEETVGCQNWVLLYIGEIATLDAWKQHSHRAGSLDVMELVRRATAIKVLVEEHMLQLETDPISTSSEGASLLDIFTSDFGQQAKMPPSQTTLVTRVWAHAALIYLFIVVSGWQPASLEVGNHVRNILELLTQQMVPPALLRSMVWPFCVAGCLAAPEQEAHFREMVQVLQPPSVFGTVRKALEIMENVWSKRCAGDAGIRDLATCFRSEGDLVILV
ncbi:hypothetical protein CC86DRAFT_344415 [Ophiobolus disseminans]|uniref:Fungal-specific transcription factor domain-containing protein n=1 Tax=Ophiobolus disseminans TaxID=1469910 RepID=A0A6A7AAZ1_9PLEO|nr:hypothetical protein CC86DRAFT_344415 [Ophiobolus disseminans]